MFHGIGVSLTSQAELVALVADYMQEEVNPTLAHTSIEDETDNGSDKSPSSPDNSYHSNEELDSADSFEGLTTGTPSVASDNFDTVTRRYSLSKATHNLRLLIPENNSYVYEVSQVSEVPAQPPSSSVSISPRSNPSPNIKGVGVVSLKTSPDGSPVHPITPERYWYELENEYFNDRAKRLQTRRPTLSPVQDDSVIIDNFDDADDACALTCCQEPVSSSLENPKRCTIDSEHSDSEAFFDDNLCEPADNLTRRPPFIGT